MNQLDQSTESEIIDTIHEFRNESPPSERKIINFIPLSLDAKGTIIIRYDVVNANQTKVHVIEVESVLTVDESVLEEQMKHEVNVISHELGNIFSSVIPNSSEDEYKYERVRDYEWNFTTKSKLTEMGDSAGIID